MAKRKKSSSVDLGPLSTMIDLAGALAMGTYVKHKVKQDYRRGQGADSIKAATMVYGAGSFRKGTAGTIALGGLLGLNSAIRDIEREGTRPRQRLSAYDDGIDVTPYKTNDNRYAWRLNCEDGSAYGLSPMDFETRDAYNLALKRAQGNESEPTEKNSNAQNPVVQFPFEDSIFLCCRVSRLDNGANEYYLIDDDNIKVGDTITVSTDAGTSDGIVIWVKRLSEMTQDEMPHEKLWILAQEDIDGREV